MPTNKDFKRLVRARMRKTGESYTAARARLLQHASRRRPPATPTAAPSAPLPADYARLAGMSDAAVKAKTGCDWKRWVDALDYAGAQGLPHRDIAALVKKKWKVGSWWAQMVTVGYERIRGLRERGQRRGGGYEAGKSRTFAVPVHALYRAFADPRRRRRWLGSARYTVRTTTRDKSLRLEWGDGTLVQVLFIRKGPAKSQVAIEHTKLPTRDALVGMKQYWSERLDALAAMLRP